MTHDEEIISSISYTNSDFRSIYPELLDTAKALSNKWDPSLSNESDPGNILIKEAAIIGDKNNYHVDKNVLECFPLSATQQSTARQLYDLAGYHMHWYNSAVSTISFALNTSVNTINENNGSALESITIPANTKVTDNSSEYTYTLLEPVTLTEPGVVQTASAIQGKITQYEINGNYTITIDNLDNNLRVYFPFSNIAENGLFVCSAGTNVEKTGFLNQPVNGSIGNFWQKVSNLTQYAPGKAIFKFGLDLDSDNCYIEFPEDIITSDLIGNGLNIYYTITAGVEGAISDKLLNIFASDLTNTDENNVNVVLNEYINISNQASTAGLNPESLDAAYRNYKKTIGTYNTLITRKDYENAIYTLTNSTDSGALISNSVVADRVSDINYSQKVIQGNLVSNYSKSFSAEDQGQAILHPYDIVLYLLKANNVLKTMADFDETFTPDLSTQTRENIRGDLDEFKAVQQDFYYITDLNADPDLYFNINNITALNGNLTTYYKVTATEASEIEKKVTQALISTYNARAIDFGESLDYDNLIATIKNADARIKTVSLDIPSYEPVVQKVNGQTLDLYTQDTNKEENTKLLAKMILSGNVQLFKFDDVFNLDFGQTDATTFSNVAAISTSNSITVPAIATEPALLDDTNSVQLDENDIVQIITPNFNVKETYNATCDYQLTGSSTYTVNSNEIYQLAANQNIVLTYSTGTKTYGPGTVIRPNNVNLAFDEKTKLRANQSIDILQLSQITLNSGTKYYIICNNKTATDYSLELTAGQKYILRDDEYFLYTNELGTGVIILGSGTALVSDTSITLTSPIATISDVSKVSMETVSTTWNQLPAQLNAQENSILTLTTGDRLCVIGTGDISTSNTIDDLDLSTYSGFIYQLSTDTGVTAIKAAVNVSDYSISYRSNMLLNANNINPQILKGAQAITFLDASNTILGSIDATTDPHYFLSSYPLVMLGGDNIDVKVLDTLTGAYSADLVIYAYNQGDISSDPTLTRRNGIYTISATTTLHYSFEPTEDIAHAYIIPYTLSKPVGATVEIAFDSDYPDASVHMFDNTAAEWGVTTDPVTENGVLFIENADNAVAEDLIITFGGTGTATLGLGKLYKLDGVNAAEINTKALANGNYFSYIIGDNTAAGEVALSDIQAAIMNLPGYNTFDWSYHVPGSAKVIEPLSGEAYFNPNHVYNRYTISKLDLGNTVIKVNPASIA